MVEQCICFQSEHIVCIHLSYVQISYFNYILQYLATHVTVHARSLRQSCAIASCLFYVINFIDHDVIVQILPYWSIWIQVSVSNPSSCQASIDIKCIYIQFTHQLIELFLHIFLYHNQLSHQYLAHLVVIDVATISFRNAVCSRKDVYLY